MSITSVPVTGAARVHCSKKCRTDDRPGWQHRDHGGNAFRIEFLRSANASPARRTATRPARICGRVDTPDAVALLDHASPIGTPIAPRPNITTPEGGRTASGFAQVMPLPLPICRIVRMSRLL